MVLENIIFRKKALIVFVVLGSLLFGGIFLVVDQVKSVAEESLLLQQWLRVKQFYLINHWKKKGTQLEVFHFANYDCDGDLFLIPDLEHRLVAKSQVWSRIIGSAMRKGECYRQFCGRGEGLWLRQVEDWLRKKFRAKEKRLRFLAFERGKCNLIG